jgi:hypothetical protein
MQRMRATDTTTSSGGGDSNYASVKRRSENAEGRNKYEYGRKGVVSRLLLILVETVLKHRAMKMRKVKVRAAT